MNIRNVFNAIAKVLKEPKSNELTKIVALSAVFGIACAAVASPFLGLSLVSGIVPILVGDAIGLTLVKAVSGTYNAFKK